MGNKVIFHFPLIFGVVFLFSCKEKRTSVTDNRNDKAVLESVITSADTLNTFPFVADRVSKIKEALKKPKPVLLYSDSASERQRLAELIALNDSMFTQFLFDPFTKRPVRNEVFGIHQARESDMAGIPGPHNLKIASG